MIRVFLDANILFSAAWREGSGLLAFWDRKDVPLVTSHYALKEAQANLHLKKPSAVPRLAHLTHQMELSAVTRGLRSDHGLPEKDRPILEAAIGSKCSVLLTGDVRDFGHLMGTETEGVRVLSVRMFIEMFPDLL